MKKYILFIALLLALPNIVSAAFPVVNQATTTTGNPPWYYPQMINGKNPWLLVEGARFSSTTATTTFANGANIESGCFAVSGTCISGGGGGSGTVNSGTQGQAAYYAANGTAVSGTSSIFFNNQSIGIGTTTPNTCQGNGVVGILCIANSAFARIYLSASSTNPHVVNSFFDSRSDTPSTARFQLGTRSNHPVSIFTNDSRRLTVATSGAVMIGTNYADHFLYNSGANSLIVEGSVGIGTTSPFAKLSINPVAGDSMSLAVGSSTATRFGIDSRGYTLVNTIAGSRAIAAPLHVNTADNTMFLTTNATASIFEIFRNNDSNVQLNLANRNVFQIAGSADTVVYGNASQIITQLFRIGGAESMALTSTGLGVGTTTPASKLDIGSKGNGTREYLQIDSEAGAPAAGDCDSLNESGRMIIDHTNDVLYVCNQHSGNGWDTVTLTP